MKKFGYIYKYSPSEGMGILVYGNWKVKGAWGTIIKNTPVLFSAKELLSKVSTGQLVYFDLDGSCVSNIERASLSNFKVDYINSFIRCGEHESECSFYDDNTNISFERLDNIIIPNKIIQKPNNRTTYETLLSTEECIPIIDEDEEDEDEYNFDDSELLDLDFFFDEFKSPYYDSAGVGAIVNNDTTANLPESINDLYNCFGKYNHTGRKESISLNVFDLSFWVDSEILTTDYFGKKVDQLKFLYDVFVLKRHYDKNGKEINVKIDNDCISSEWSLLLSKFSDVDLEEILNIAPKLQPALPVKFCKKNAGLLSDDYGMPNVEICKLQCLHKISSARTISEYKVLKERLSVYRHCAAKHFEGEGTPMCRMGKRRITNLEKILEERFESIIKPDIITQITLLSVDDKIEKLINSLTPDEFNNVGLCLEHFNKLRDNFLGYNACETALKSFDKLPQLFKDALKTSLLKCANESAISATKSDYLTPFRMGYNVEQFGDWILDSTKQKIKELVNDRFSNLDDIEELNHAFNYYYITDEQYYNKYVQLTCDYSICQFLKELSDYGIEDSPLTIQWYVVSNIIEQLGYDSLSSRNYVNTDGYGTIWDIRSLLAWLENHGHINDNVLKKAEEKICSVLSNDERWILFEEKIVKSPGIENIRKQLDEAYIRKSINQELLKYTCFQDIMMSDMDNVKDPEVLLFIADNLDSTHQNLMERKANGFMKLYLWQKQPSESLDWDLVKSHYHELSVDAQIRILRYIFGLISYEDSFLSLDTLFSEFVETSTPANPAICGILYLLKAKKDNMNVSITPAMVESVIGAELKQRFIFLQESKELFYPCSGYLVISAEEQDTEYLSFYGILTKENKNNKLYYVVTFYDSPVDLFGQTIWWLADSEEIDNAEQVLLRNAYVEIENDKYYIAESQELFVKQYVMSYHIDDRCGLVSDKESLIKLGLLPRNNAYKPLYTNVLRKFEDSDNYICKCGCVGNSDPNNGIPFFWCQKKICVRRSHFLLPPTQWEKYRFADLLYIAIGQKPNKIADVWRVNAEISKFICDYTQIFKSDHRNIYSAALNDDEEKGTWNEESSTYREIYDEDQDDYDDGDYYDEDYDDGEECYSPWDDEPTYDRYNGSYAQDVMGYSDDEIDTIFDGEPDAYWNID